MLSWQALPIRPRLPTLKADELPAGTVTLLFTDVEGSTRMLQVVGREVYVRALTEHRRLLRAAFCLHGGIEVEMQGDSFFFAFPFAREAVAAAAAGQRALHAHEWEPQPIRVRMGLHTGEPMQADGLYAGLDVHRAARVMGAARGSQVLVSARTADLVDGELPDSVSLRDMGEYELKDFAVPQRLYALDIDGLSSESPAVADPKFRSAAWRRTRVRRAATVVAFVAIVIALSAMYAATRSGADAMIAPPNSVAVIDPAENAVVSVIPVGTRPTSIVGGGGAMWILNTGEETVSRIDVRTRELARTFSAGSTASDIAFADGAVWVADAAADIVLVLDESGGVEARIPLGIRHVGARNGPPRIALASSGGEVWATGGSGLATVVMSSALRRVVRRIAGVRGVNADSTPSGPDIAIGESGVWATDGTDELFRIDRLPHEIVQLGGFAGDQGITGIAVDPDYVWASGAGVAWQVRSSLARPTTTYPVGAGPTDIAVGGSFVWTANALDGTVSRIDVSSRRTTTIAVGGTPSHVTFASGLIWVTID
jgi:class 3 adenylate cyclase/DNA-binding beta-propeller fold protein YncE